MLNCYCDFFVLMISSELDGIFGALKEEEMERKMRTKKGFDEKGEVRSS